MHPQALVAVIFLLAGFIQGLSGFGSALVAMPLLLLFLDARTAVPLCILCGIVITGFLTVRLRSHLNRKTIMPLAIGCMPGIVIGVAFLKIADDRLIKILLGIMLISYCLYHMIMKPKSRSLHAAWAYLAGFGTGFIGAAFSAGGPPAIIHATLTGVTKQTIKATLTGFFFLTGLVIAAAHALTGLTTLPVLKHFLVAAIPVLVGVIAGSALYEKISLSSYLRIIHGLLLITGAMMIVSGVYGF